LVEKGDYPLKVFAERQSRANAAVLWRTRAKFVVNNKNCTDLLSTEIITSVKMRANPTTPVKTLQDYQNKIDNGYGGILASRGESSILDRRCYFIVVLISSINKRGGDSSVPIFIFIGLYHPITPTTDFALT
jgi:hypothetical protein